MKKKSEAPPSAAIKQKQESQGDRPPHKQLWTLTDHICRSCAGGRILRCENTGMSPGGNPLFRCADCGQSCHGFSPEGICYCGMHFKNNTDCAYMCLPFSIITEHPEIEEAFMRCGFDRTRGEVGIVTKADLRDLKTSGKINYSRNLEKKA